MVKIGTFYAISMEQKWWWWDCDSGAEKWRGWGGEEDDQNPANIGWGRRLGGMGGKTPSSGFRLRCCYYTLLKKNNKIK